MPKDPDPYSKIARFYDRIMGQRADIPYVERIIEQHHSRAKSLLELACGTGTALAPLSAKYDVTGLDASASMLQIAESTILHGSFLKADMRNFSLKRKFDVILCIFDSLNHLTKFADWKKVFRRAREHLNESGVFIFDVNSEYRFQSYAEDSPFVDELGEHVCIFDVVPTRGGTYTLDVRVFEKQLGNNFALHQAKIVERTFSRSDIYQALRQQFSKVRAYGDNFAKVTPTTESIYYVCFA